MSSLSNELTQRRSDNLIGTKNLLYKDSFVITRGEMQFLYDESGNKYLDMLGGFSVIAFGHANPFIVNEITNQLNKVTHSTQIFLNEPIVELAERLHENLDNSLHKSFFLNSGSEANEMAISLAKKHTGKDDVLFMEKSLHGRTRLTLQVTNMKMWHPEEAMNDENLLVTSYYPEDNVSFENQMKLSLQDLESKLKVNDNIACMIIEPIQGNGGVRFPHKDYFKKLKQLLSKYGVLLIIDEAQTGLGRTGHTYAHQYFDVVPDILMTCKALGNGMPISSVTTTNDIAASFNVPTASTTGGNMVSCASAIGCLKYYGEFSILARVNKLIPVFDQILENLNNRFNIIKSIRGIGLMRGIEFETETLETIIEELKVEGIIVGKSGEFREVMLLEPPLVINEQDLYQFEEAIIKVLEKIN